MLSWHMPRVCLLHIILVTPQNWADETFVFHAVCLVMGLLVMMTPSRWSAPIFRALSLPLSVALAVWHACAYTATAVAPHEVRASAEIGAYQAPTSMADPRAAISCTLTAHLKI